MLSVERVSRWRPPLSCSIDESIKKISFNDKHIVLAINNSNKSPKNRLEFRTRGMLVLRQIALDENVDFISLSLLSVKGEWILGQKKNHNRPRHYTLIDNDLHIHEQNILSTQNIENIAVINHPDRKTSLAIHRKRNDVHTSRDNIQRPVLDLYEIE
jgi:hypothetical protein